MTFPVFFAAFVLVFFAAQAAMASRFIAALRDWKRDLTADEDCPKATILLCLRGKDPFLKDCLEGLLNQDYPSYEVRVIVDHENDPAREVVHQFLDDPEAANLTIGLLTNRLESCSLKCSSLIEAVDQLDDSCEVIALLDADTVPHSTWLRELATALQQEGVGAATGNRWYVPSTASLGAVTRYLWNTFAIVQMYCFRIPWGGSLALKTRVLREANLPELWGQAFCEDTMLYRVLKRQGLRIAFVPSVLMANREACRASDLFGWIQRQLLTVRLYHPGWAAVLCHGLFTAALPMVLGIGLLASNWESAPSIAGIAVAYGLAMASLLWLIELRIGKILEARGESTDWLTFPAFLKLLAAIPLLQLLYPAALAAAAFLRRTRWRGIDYHIGGPWKIRRLDYAPFAKESEKTDESL